MQPGYIQDMRTTIRIDDNLLMLAGKTALENQQPPLKEVVCEQRPIGAYGAAKAAKKRNILKAKPYPITSTKGGGFSSGKSTLTAVIEEALKEKLLRNRKPPGTAKVSIATFKGKGLLQGIDLVDSASLLKQ